MLRTIRGIEYELKQTSRKNLLLRVDVACRVVCLAPRGVRLRDADAFVLSKRDWIAENLQKMRSVRESAAARNALAPDSILFRGKPVRIECKIGSPQSCTLSGDVLHLCVSDASPEHIREVLRGFLIDEANRVIEERFQFYIPFIGRQPTRVTVREQKTRWGSCSNHNTISINWKLIMAPSECLDYVVIHELCHLYEFDHSPAFWKRVEQYQKDYKVWKKWLKDNNSVLSV